MAKPSSEAGGKEASTDLSELWPGKRSLPRWVRGAEWPPRRASSDLAHRENRQAASACLRSLWLAHVEIELVDQPVDIWTAVAAQHLQSQPITELLECKQKPPLQANLDQLWLLGTALERIGGEELHGVLHLLGLCSVSVPSAPASESHTAWGRSGLLGHGLGAIDPAGGLARNRRDQP